MMYKLVTQKPYCCVPACLQMIFQKRKMKKISQEKIGWYLGLTVPKSSKKHFKKVRVSSNNKLYGIDIKKFSINKFFSSAGYALKFTYYSPNKIKNLEKFLEAQVKKNNDVIVCFRNEALVGYGKYGHVAVIEKFDKDKIILADPNLRKARYRKVATPKLVKAMKLNMRDMGGLWIISKK